MSRVVFAKTARTDLVEIWKYLQPRSPHSAGRVVDEIESAIRKLAEMPGMGHTRADVPDAQYRFWRVYSYIIVYRHARKTLHVVRIVHGARDLRRLLGP